MLDYSSTELVMEPSARDIMTSRRFDMLTLMALGLE